MEHDVWTLLRGLLHQRADGGFDVPIFGHDADTRFLDSDRPKREFMNDRFAAPLSERQGEIHTVCVGRPFGIDFLAAARRGIHVHVYCNNVDDIYGAIASQLRSREARRSLSLLRRYLHIREPRQTIGRDWAEVLRTKSQWVEEFSRYDAAWSYIGTPFRWTTLDDRAAIPNRLGTYLLAGLPVITDRRDRYYRYEQLRERGVEIELPGCDYDDLKCRLQAEIQTREKRHNAIERRHSYSFEATIEPLLTALEQARERYFARTRSERVRFLPSSCRRLVHLTPSPGPRPAPEHSPLLVNSWRSRRLARSLRSHLAGEVRAGLAVREP